MLNRILVACVGIPVILVALFVLPPIFTPILIGVLSAVGTYEALHAIKMNHPRIALYTMLLALAVPFWVYFGEIRHWALLALIIYLILVFLEAFFSGFRVRIERVGSGFFFALLISYCLSSVVSLGNLELRTSYVLLPIASEVAPYYRWEDFRQFCLARKAVARQILDATKPLKS